MPGPLAEVLDVLPYGLLKDKRSSSRNAAKDKKRKRKRKHSPDADAVGRLLSHLISQIEF